MANEFPILNGLLQSNLDCAGFTLLDLPSLKFAQGASALSFFNTADEVTDYERARLAWLANVFTLAIDRGGTGLARTFELTITNNASSSTPALVSILPTITQSGTAGYTALLVNVTEGSTGSGGKVLLDLQVDGATKWRLTRTGAMQVGDEDSASVTTHTFQNGVSALGTFIRIAFTGKDSGGGAGAYGQLDWVIQDNTAGAEVGTFKVRLPTIAGGLGVPEDVFKFTGSGYAALPAGQSLRVWNTADETIDFEGATLGFDSDVLTLSTTKGGTGEGRSIALETAGNTASSGSEDLVSILPTVAQSGTAAYTALLVNATESSIGSGDSFLLALENSGTPYLRIGRIGRSLFRTPIFSLSSDAGTFSSTSASMITGNHFTIVPSTTSLALFFKDADGATDAKLWTLTFDAGAAIWQVQADGLASSFQVLRFVRETGGTLDYLYSSFDSGSLIVGQDSVYSKTPLGRLHVYEPTMGDVVEVQESESTLGDNVLEYRRHYDVNTTDATTTTLGTLTLLSGKTYQVEATIVARRTGGGSGTAEDGAGYIVAGTFKTVAGSATVIGSVTAVHTAEDQAGWAATLDTSGTGVRVRVTGAAGNNVTWHCVLKYGYVGA